MKIYSSVKIVVEKGGKLTLDDSVAYGAVEVNGGTLSAKNSSSFVNQITLNDGSALEDAKSDPMLTTLPTETTRSKRRRLPCKRMVR